MTRTAHISVLCVDDHIVVLRGLAAIIGQDPNIAVIACAASAEEGVEKYLRHRPDVTLMDLQLPGMSGFDAIRAIRQADPGARILVLTMHQGVEDIYRALHAGAAGYLLKDTLADNLIHAIHEVHAGRRAVADSVMANLESRDKDPPLSQREIEIIHMLAKGMRNKEIGATLGISDGTVHAHVKNIFTKLHVHDRTLALAVAVRRGILHLS